MKRVIIVLVGVLLFATTAYCDDTAYKQSDVYKKAIKKYDKHCTDLDANHIASLRERAKNQAEQGWTKGAMLKDTRKFSQEKGQEKEFNHCLVAIVYLELAPLKFKAEQEAKLYEALKKQFDEIREAKKKKELVDSLTETEIRWILISEESRLEQIDKWRQKIKYIPQDEHEYYNSEIIRLINMDFFYPLVFDLSNLRIGSAGYMRNNFEVLQIVSPSVVLVNYDDKTFWWEGVSTTGMTDGELFTTKSAFLITGTKSYTTVLSASKTVFTLKSFPVDKDKFDKLNRADINKIVANHK